MASTLAFWRYIPLTVRYNRFDIVSLLGFDKCFPRRMDVLLDNESLTTGVDSSCRSEATPEDDQA